MIVLMSTCTVWLLLFDLTGVYYLAKFIGPDCSVYSFLCAVSIHSSILMARALYLIDSEV